MATLRHSPDGTQAGSVLGVNNWTLIKPRAIELCQQYGISLPSAYRHIQHQTTPSPERRIGKDGKQYPADGGHRNGRKPPLGPVEKDLHLARLALLRADRQANRVGVSSEARAALSWLVELASGTLQRWRAG
jgi:hypothetical protein